MTRLVWYVSYGSNMAAGRFDCYLRGGIPSGGRWRYPGCRDPRPARADRAVFVDGAIYFAGRSPTWGGGMAFLNTQAPGRTPARAWQITVEQFADVCAQEMRHAPGCVEVPLGRLTSTGRHRLGPGRYETLVHLGDLDGLPMITFTSPDRVRPPNPPSSPYLAMIVAGLGETHGWSPEQARRHLRDAVEGLPEGQRDLTGPRFDVPGPGTGGIGPLGGQLPRRGDA